MAMIRVDPARGGGDLEATAELLLAYAEVLRPHARPTRVLEDARDLPGRPGRYRPPGEILLARVDGRPAGILALEDLGDGVVELKRLYVDPRARRQGVGGMLVDRALAIARERGFREAYLETLPPLEAARRLYRSRGFLDASVRDAGKPGEVFVAMARPL